MSTAPGMKAHRARARVRALQQATGRRVSEHVFHGRHVGPAGNAKYRAIDSAQAPGRRIARAALRQRKLDLAAAIKRLERVGAEFPRTDAAIPRARRLRALKRAFDRRVRVNPRKAPTMAKRKRKKGLIHRVRNRLGRFISGAPKRRRKKSRASKARRAAHTTQGVTTMSRALVANPRKKRRRARRRTTTTNPRRRRRSHRRHVAARNPRRRRHIRHRGRHRRNPGMGGGFVKAAMGSLLPMGLGGLGGAVCGLADAKFMSDKPVISALSKVVLGAAGAALLRKRPALAAGWAGGVMGSFGYSMGVKAAGGLVAHSPTSALKGIADMAQDNPEMAALLEGLTPDDGVGDITDDMGDAGDYVEALSGSDDGDGMGDVVEAD